jgi:hypothetical protein
MNNLQTVIDKLVEKNTLEARNAIWEIAQLLEYESRLPEMTNEEYSKWFEQSVLVYGVRMGPKVKEE